MENNEIFSFNNNRYFSQSLRNIDLRLKFKEFAEEKSFSKLNKIKKEQQEKLNMLKRRHNHKEIIYNLKKAYNDYLILSNMKESNTKEESNKNQEILPKLVNKSNKETEKNNNNNNTNDKNKGNNNESNTKNKNNKEQFIEFDNVWKREFLQKMKEKNNSIPDIMIDNNNTNNESDEKNDIFDKNYKKKCQKKLIKSKIIEKIKNYNLRVKIKLRDYKNIMDKFSERKEYNPNYTALEKHMPTVKLNTKSKRIYPYKFMKIYNYSTEKNIFRKKLIKNNSSKNFTKNNYKINPCSLFNRTIKKNSIINDLYNTIYNSIANNTNYSDYLFKGSKTKGHSILENGNIIYEI